MNRDSKSVIAPAIVGCVIVAGATMMLRSTVDTVGDAASDVIRTTGDAAGEVIRTTGETTKDIFTDPSDVVTGRGGSGTGGGGRLTPARIIEMIANGTGEAIEIGDVIADEMIGLSIQEEIEVGRDIHRQIARDPSMPISRDAEMTDWLRTLAAPFLDDRARTRTMDYHVFLIEDDTINAFAHAGGYVYVHRGLLEAMDYDPHAVKFVLGHEIAHIELGQCARRVYAQRRLEEMVGRNPISAIGTLAHRNLQVNYSQDDEFRCDAWSYRSMRRMGHSSDAGQRGVEFLVSLEQATGRGDRDDGPARDAREALGRALYDHFATHPPAKDRLAQLESID